MEEILLKDICDLDNGYAFRSDDYVESSDTLNCRMSNIRPDGTFDILYSAKYLPDVFAEKYEDYLLYDGDLIIAMTDMAGDPKILGVPTVVDTKGYKLLLNQRVGKLRFIKPGVNADYLKLALQSKRVREYLKKFAGGGVQLNVSKKDILNAPVRMRTEEEQNYIADLFRRVLEIKKQREHELLCLDNLIKARFVEMFGSNSSKVPLSDYCDVSGGYSFKSGDITTDGAIRILQIGNVSLNDVNWDTTNYLPQGYDDTYSRFLLNEGDIVVALTRPIIQSLGNVKACIVKAIDTPCLLNQRVGRITSKKDMNTDLKYIFGCLMTEDFTRYVESCCIGCSQPNISTKDIENFMIPAATSNEQKEFVRFSEQVDKSKTVVQKSLDDTKVLFDSLMQQYFG